MEPGSGSLVDLEGQGMDRSIVHEEAEERGEMFSSLREGDWNSMLEFLKQHGSRSSIVHPVSTEFKDTIVHAAAALGQTEVVKDLLVRIKEMNLEMSLGVLLANQLGNNPLHSAALMGQVGTLRVIFEEVPELASARNIYGETPIFQAAVSGSKQVFSELASMLPPDTKDIITMLRRNDGDTILHCALSGEYFVYKLYCMC
ncbi:ankyrin repeat-containing protein NPR4-like protein [Cinnamomum micranthum f. kanehirae]|uniref:Ankyrin repeat-containing protein NPR4-like protein n=1 Tax=Cinnamomum micranthum f. kanehirae TaxID=337451 RepID=A0A443Q5B2_9MAGN|nr:ankyrin repeat-containing protein NPR4-like protein [Cinnamomum micranthum f. kanehirae]